MLAAYKAAYKACRLRRLCFFDGVCCCGRNTGDEVLTSVHADRWG